MNFKFLLQGACLSMLYSLALAKNACKDFSEYTYNCVANSKGKITELEFIMHNDKPEDDILKKLSTQSSLKKLDFHYYCPGECETSMETVLNSISKLTNLKELHLNYDKNYTGMVANTHYLQTIPKGFFKNFKNLKVLDLKYIRFDRYNVDEIAALPKLRELELDTCDHFDIDFSPFLNSQVSTLKFITGYESRIKDNYEYLRFDDLHLKRFNHLKKLELDCNETCDFDTHAFEQLIGLEEITLGHIKITKDIVRQLKVLKDNGLKSIVTENCCNLKNVKISSIKSIYTGKDERDYCSSDKKNDEEVEAPEVPISTDGKCGKDHGKCPSGKCCSKWGYCGKSSDYCGKGCQSEFGKCN